MIFFTFFFLEWLFFIQKAIKWPSVTSRFDGDAGLYPSAKAPTWSAAPFPSVGIFAEFSHYFRTIFALFSDHFRTDGSKDRRGTCSKFRNKRGPRISDFGKTKGNERDPESSVFTRVSRFAILVWVLSVVEFKKNSNDAGDLLHLLKDSNFPHPVGKYT